MDTITRIGRAATRAYFGTLRQHLSSTKWSCDDRTAALVCRVVREVEAALHDNGRRRPLGSPWIARSETPNER